MTQGKKTFLFHILASYYNENPRFVYSSDTGINEPVSLFLCAGCSGKGESMNYPVANKDLRLLMKNAGVPLWMVAKSLGIAEVTLSRWLRVELEPANPKRALILDGITTAEAEKAEAEKKEVDA